MPQTSLLAQNISWGACQFNSSIPVVCGNLSVRLDYTDPYSGTLLRLELLKVPAVKEPVRGSILFNFGGPGMDGRRMLASDATLYQAITGGYHDLITHAPRGTGDTLPFICHGDSIEDDSLLSDDSPDTARQKLWKTVNVYDMACSNTQSKTGDLIGTAFTARDLMSIVDALGEDGLLRYWGISYGTLLGATVAAMFPDRMDKLILDGVVNPHQYYHGFGLEAFTDTDKVFDGFCRLCVDNAGTCELAGDHNATELRIAIYSALETLRHENLTIQASGEKQVMAYDMVKPFIAKSLYDPAAWPKLAKLINAVLTNNMTILGALIQNQHSQPEKVEASDSLVGIKCSDSFVRESGLVDITPILNKLHKRSTIAGEIATLQIMACARWGIAAKERYDGDFRVDTKNPALIIGNSFDPITPLVSARNLSSGFEGSVVLQQNSYGHSSMSQASLCTAKAISAYIMNGTLPLPGTVCESDQHPFKETPRWSEVLKGLGFAGQVGNESYVGRVIAMHDSRLYW